MEFLPGVSMEGRRHEQKTAIVSIDVEADYAGPKQVGLDRLPELLSLVRELNVPLTAFVEGKLFVKRPALCESLIEAGADIQLHCYDHSLGGETPHSLARGVAAYRRIVGRRPEGYRAGSYRLSGEIYQALLDNGFRWDSSIMPAIGLGGRPRLAFRPGDYFLLDGRLVEFPVAAWRGIPLPLTHAYRRLMKRPGETLLRRICTLPRLLVYNMHMVDLVWTGSLGSSPLSPMMKGLYLCAWGSNRENSFNSLREFCGFLRGEGYTFATASGTYRTVADEPVAAAALP